MVWQTRLIPKYQDGQKFILNSGEVNRYGYLQKNWQKKFGTEYNIEHGVGVIRAEG